MYRLQQSTWHPNARRALLMRTEVRFRVFLCFLQNFESKIWGKTLTIPGQVNEISQSVGHRLVRLTGCPRPNLRHRSPVVVDTSGNICDGIHVGAHVGMSQRRKRRLRSVRLSLSLGLRLGLLRLRLRARLSVARGAKKRARLRWCHKLRHACRESR